MYQTKSMQEVFKAQNVRETLKSMRKTFRIMYPKDRVRDLLICSYAQEVALRGRIAREHPDLRAAAETAAEVLTGASDNFGIIIMGRVGTGKTTFMKAIQRTLNWFVYKRMLEYGTGLRIVTAKSIHNSEATRSRFRLLCEDELLGIDDLGAEPKEELVFGRPVTPLTDLLEYRYDKQLLTVATTNLSAAMIRSKYGERIADRCREMFATVVFSNDSYR